MVMDEEEMITALRRWLDTAGAEPDPAELARQLAPVWHAFQGSEQTGMSREKLLDRVEQPSWQPPRLEFAIERHGRTVMGSTYADVYLWQLDFDRRTATTAETGPKQRRIGKVQRPLDVKSVARRVSEAVKNGMKKPWLKWRNAERLRIMVGELPELADGSAVAQTLTARRRRFRKALEEEMTQIGFVPEGRYYCFRRQP